MYNIWIFITFFCFLPTSNAHAQKASMKPAEKAAEKSSDAKSDGKSETKKGTVNYTNDNDAAITLHGVTFLPTTDNVDGIFARPFDKKLQELLREDHQWDYKDSHFAGTLYSPADLIKDPQKIIKIGKPLQVDGVILIDIRKNPKDVFVSFYLFSTRDGMLISQVNSNSMDSASTEKALEQLQELYKQTKSKIPYDGLILSRTKNRVTLNLGELDGVTQGQELSCVKIIEVKRHPKLGSILQHEKAILGKIKLIKVDKTLSFADVISEIEAGAIQVDTKVVGARVQKYTPENWINKDYLPPELLLSENNKENGKVQEWRPEMPPTFGMVSAGLGFSNYKHNLTLADGTSLTTSSHLYPSINLNGEIWINPQWYVNFGLSQGTDSMTNPAPGGSPGDLSSTMAQYSLDVGYNLLLKDDFWDSKLFAALGFYSFDLNIDDSNPQGGGLTSTKITGARITLGGRTPIDMDKRWYMGGALMVYINPTFKESPMNSGSADARVVNFDTHLDYRWSERLWINGSLDFKTFMTDFSGTGTRTTPATKGSQKMQTLTLGVSYMF